MRILDDRLAVLLGAWDQPPGPRWQRLATRLATLIEEGTLLDGVTLPTERGLAASLRVSRSTVAGAYDHLERAGLLAGRQGSGTTVCRPHGTPPGPRGTSAMFASLGGGTPGVIDLSLAETRCAPATKAALAALDPDWLLDQVAGTGYHPQGYPPLRAALADWLGNRGVPVAVEGLVTTTGAQQALALATQVLCPPAATVLVEEATYPGALEVFRRLGLRAVSVPGDRHGPDPEAFDALAARLHPALAYLIPVGNNPTAGVMSASRFEAVAAVLARTGVPVIDDRTPEPLAPDGVRVPSFATRLPAGQVVTVASMSKIAWAGLRTGWLVTSPALAADVVAARIAADLAGPVLSQAAALALVPRLDHLAAGVRADLAVRTAVALDVLAQELPQWAVDAPRAGAWLWARLPDGADATTLAETAERAGVRVTAGPVFSADARLRDRVRVSLVEEPAVLAEGLRRLAAAWRSLPGPSSARPEASLLVI